MRYIFFIFSLNNLLRHNLIWFLFYMLHAGCSPVQAKFCDKNKNMNNILRFHTYWLKKWDRLHEQKNIKIAGYTFFISRNNIILQGF